MGTGRFILILVGCFGLLSAGWFNGQEPGSPQPRVTGAAWEIIGPGGGGAQYIPTINPADPNHVFIRCDMTGAYVTEDGGETWRMFNLRTVVRDFEFDPSRPDTVYACNSGLYRSDDRGRHWSLVYPDPDDVIEETMRGDHADHRFKTKSGMPDSSIVKIRVDPADTNRVYLGLSRGARGDGLSRLLRSRDRGKTWEQLAQPQGDEVLGIFPGSWAGRPDEVTVLTNESCIRVSADGKASALALPVERVAVADGGAGPTGSYIYLLEETRRPPGGTPGALYRSSDLGKTWTSAMGNLLHGAAQAGKIPVLDTFAVSERHAQVLYLSCSSRWVEDSGSLQRHSGILKTTDGGRRWQWVLEVSAGGIVSGNFRGGWLLRNMGWFRNPSHLGVSPTNPDVVYGTDSGRTFKTESGGRSWDQLISKDFEDRSFTTRGLDVTTTYGVHFDPFDREHLFITYTDIGLFHSFNGGKSWHQAISGIPRQWRNTCYWLEFDPAVRGRIYSAWSNVHDLPRPKMHRSGNLVNGNQEGGVAVSTDNGRWWELLQKGVLQKDGTHRNGLRPGAVCTHIVLDPASPVDSRTLYVCDYGYGVWKSTDGGTTWATRNRGIDPSNMNCWRITRLPSGRLILLIARAGVEGNSQIPGKMYTSDDGAESWQRVALPEEITAPNDLVYDPPNSERMYLSCWPLSRGDREVGGGLYRTENGGESWKQVFKENKHVYAAAVDPGAPDTVFLATFNSALYRSGNRGNSWQRLGGFNFKWAHRPVPDIHNPGMLYVTTFGGSVFHGPATGLPGAFEDIENLRPVE